MRFLFKKTRITGVIIVKPEVGSDSRGSYSENYKASEFLKAGMGSPQETEKIVR
jgi:dTDP-4-dehydrorhamnose 3,5-epimerase-like enzyme